MTQYDLVPEVIYNALEKKFGEMVKSMVSATYYRQMELDKQNKELYVKSHYIDAKLSDIQMLIKKEFD